MWSCSAEYSPLCSGNITALNYVDANSCSPNSRNFLLFDCTAEYHGSRAPSLLWTRNENQNEDVHLQTVSHFAVSEYTFGDRRLVRSRRNISANYIVPGDFFDCKATSSTDDWYRIENIAERSSASNKLNRCQTVAVTSEGLYCYVVPNPIMPKHFK